jgi:hypothetical protein
VTQQPAAGSDPGSLEIDTSVATEARVYDYLLGGTNNFPVDQQVAKMQAEAFGGLDNAMCTVRANRLFLGRAVRYLVDEAGVRQFLDVGTGLPTANNVHQVAQALVPASRVVYVDYDALVLRHASELLTSTPEGATAYVQADLREPGKILEEAAKTLDLAQPVAVMIVSMLHFVADEEDPSAIVRGYLDRLPSGSHLVVTHLASEIQPERMAALAEFSASSDETTYVFHPRTRDKVARFFDGLDLVPPGVVQIDRWRPAGGEVPERPPGIGEPAYHAGVARKP